MPVQFPGKVALRRHAFGAQSAFGTPVAATAAYAFSGAPSVDPAWTDITEDLGSVDPVLRPVRGPIDAVAELADDQLGYDRLGFLMAATFGAGINADSTGSAWVHEPTATEHARSVWSYEYGDDGSGDWFQLADGLLESLVITGDHQTVLRAEMGWRFGAVRYAETPTPGLLAEPHPVPVYLGDAELFIDDAYDDMGTTKISDALHGFTMTLGQQIGRHRPPDNIGFDLADLHPGTRTIDVELRFAKTADTVAEVDAWFSERAVRRYVELRFTSRVDPSASWSLRLPLRYITRTEGALSANSIITLTGRAFRHFVPPLPATLVRSYGAGQNINSAGHIPFDVLSSDPGDRVLYAVMLHTLDDPPLVQWQPDNNSPASRETMTHLASIDATGNNMGGIATLSMYHLIDPTPNVTGPHFRVTPDDLWSFGTWLVAGVDQTTPELAIATNAGGQGTSSELSIATPSGALVLDCAGWTMWSTGDASAMPSAASGQTTDWAIAKNAPTAQHDSCFGGGNSLGTTSLSWSWDPSRYWMAGAIVVRPK